MSEYALEMVNISKKFGNIYANKNVNLKVKYGEIHALLGENGAGKSTLMNILSGIYQKDEGELIVEGKKANISTPQDAIDLKIGMVHQHFKLVDDFTAMENIMVGKRPSNIKKAREEVEDILQKYTFALDLDKYVHHMSVSEKQILEIIKALYGGAKILILDEPTTVFTPGENEKLFKVLEIMKEKGHGVIIITHKLGEVMRVSDYVTILRRGESIETLKTSEAEPEKLISLMVGKELSLDIPRFPRPKLKETLLRLENISYSSPIEGKILEDLTMEVNKGEILGIAGLVGNGQKQLCEIIAGLLKPDKGKIYFQGEDITGKSPREMIKLGIALGFVPEDRLGMGLVPSMDITGNMMIKDYYKGKSPFLNFKDTRVKAEKIVEALDIQTPSINQKVGKLSGGNIQKVLIGREISLEPKLLVTAYVVRGLDIGASYKIYDLINEQKAKGVGVIFVGEDIDVLLAFTDKIAVLSNKTIGAILDSRETTKEQVGLYMAGEREEINA